MNFRDVKNHETGHAFRVRLVERGDHIGQNESRIHDKTDPLVEFYDAEQGDPPLGRPIARYYLSTLKGNDIRGPRRSILDGTTWFDLHAGDNPWKIDPAGIRDVRIALQEMGAFKWRPDRSSF